MFHRTHTSSLRHKYKHNLEVHCCLYSEIWACQKENDRGHPFSFNNRRVEITSKEACISHAVVARLMDTKAQVVKQSRGAGSRWYTYKMTWRTAAFASLRCYRIYCCSGVKSESQSGSFGRENGPDWRFIISPRKLSRTSIRIWFAHGVSDLKISDNS